MKHSQTTLPNPKFWNCCKPTDHSSVDFDLFADRYIDYVMGHFGQIRRNFEITKHKNWSDFPRYALEKYPALGYAATRRRLSLAELKLIEEIQKLLEKEHYLLHKIYKEDAEYLQQVGKPLEFLGLLKRKYPYPPRNAWELDQAFAAAEEVMLVLNV